MPPTSPQSSHLSCREWRWSERTKQSKCSTKYGTAECCSIMSWAHKVARAALAEEAVAAPRLEPVALVALVTSSIRRLTTLPLRLILVRRVRRVQHPLYRRLAPGHGFLFGVGF